MAAASQTIRQQIWEGRLPLQINLSRAECRVFDKAEPYIISFPRLSYLPFLLPRLLDFFKSYLIESEPVYPYQGWFSFEGVPLKWHYPVGLLYDLYTGAGPSASIYSAKGQDDDRDLNHLSQGILPWKLTLHFQNWPDQELVSLDAEERVMHDFFMNSVKEADFVRNGTGKSIMALSREDSRKLWASIQEHSFQTFHRVNSTLLPNLSTPFRNVPLRVYLPTASGLEKPSIKVVQSQFPPKIPASVSGGAGQQVQTIGTALNSLIPSLFPDAKATSIATPILHGAEVPMNAPVEEVGRCAAYADGWLNVVIRVHE
ncbi:autophagy protein 5 [Microsporum canis]|uniref:Autophagy protein 5 n=1 Tax=Arthroderma otae (strain ATCC MYA-4605 / CBS 113480) TaxID=554155 RepID=C5FW73_ARTOC|nr:autophagy protein 5 [Microsporum canis CBS 113480]EEQ34157.1 autophagy protein 5 [Microsporum canis CBS 113480]